MAKQIGVVGVDSGLLRIVDPSYLDDYRSDILPHIGNKISYQEKFGIIGPTGKSVVVGGFGGDGVFPVLIEEKDGLVSKLIVDFTQSPSKRTNPSSGISTLIISSLALALMYGMSRFKALTQ